MQDALVRAKLSSNWNNISKTRNESVSHIKQAARMAKPKGENTNKEDPNTRNKQLQLINDAEGRKSDLQEMCDKVRLYRKIDNQLVKLYGTDDKNGKFDIKVFNDVLKKSSRMRQETE